MSFARYAEAAHKARQAPSAAAGKTPTKASTGPHIDRDVLAEMARQAVTDYIAGPRQVAVQPRPPRRSMDDPEASKIMRHRRATTYPAAAQRLAQCPDLSASEAAEILECVWASDPNRTCAVKGM